MTSEDVIRNINRKLKDDLISNDAQVAPRPTLDDVLCAIVFVAFITLLIYI